MVKRMLRSALVVVTSVVALMTVQSAPALAHYTSIYHGSDNAWVYDGHVRLGVQDNECDGNRVYAQMYLSNGDLWTLYDDNGCSQGAAFITFSITISRYRVCEASVGCSAWRST